MKNKLIILLLSISLLIPVGIASSTYHSDSSTSVINSDGISSSKSVIMSPLGGQITFSKFTSLSKSDSMFSGCIFDGEKIWLIPFSYGKIVYYSKSGEANTVDIDKIESGTSLYYGGAFDGKSIYLAPYGAKNILQIDKETKQIQEIEINKGNSRYKGAFFDGENVWFFPSRGKDILAVDSLGEIKRHTIPYDIPVSDAFCGGIIFNGKLYLVPDGAKEIITMDCKSGEFDKISAEFEISSCSGVISDGESLWFIPKENTAILKLNPQNNTLTKIELPSNGTGSLRFGGGAFDGRNLWLAPYDGDAVVKYDTFLGEFKSYTLESGTESYLGGAFDGESVWLAPYSATSPLKIKGDNSPPTVMNIFLETPVNSTIESELEANDSDEGDTPVFTVSKEPEIGSLNLNSESGKFIYTAGGSAGEDSFYYYASDSADKSNIGKVTIKITADESINTGKYIDLWDHWAEDAALYLTDNEVLTGEKVDTDFYFDPDNKMTRGQFIVWANSAFGFDGSTNDNTLPFEDTKDAPKWIVKAASAAYQNKLIMGSLDGDKLYFKPYENLTRVEVLTILYNVLRPEAADDVVLDFADSETFPDWSVDILKALKNSGVLNGYDDNTLRVYNTVTRAEAARLLYETLTNMQGKTKSNERLK